MKRSAGMIAFTGGGRRTAARLAEGMKENWHVDHFDSQRCNLHGYVKKCFSECDAIVFVGAAGIAVRLIAPYIRSKDRDPAVLAADERGRYIIPLLSGHIGGANRMAEELALITGGEAVITTATDINGVFAADTWAVENGCSIADISVIKEVSSALLRGESVGFDPGEFPVKGRLPQGLVEGNAETGICISLSGREEKYDRTLNIVPRIAAIGLGCRKGTGSREFEKKVTEMLAAAGLSLAAVERAASIDLKRDEKCINDFCSKYDIPFITYSAEELMAADGDFASSDFVRKITGTDNVCERSAVLAGGGKLVMKKRAADGVTAAAALREWEVRF